MPNLLPVTLDFGTLPQTGQGYTPQEFANRLGTNARVFTEQAFALFVTGSTAPTSDVGPWAANGNSWYYWDSGTGTYVPFVVPPESLRYSVSATTPDPTVYLFWIKLDGLGAPLGVFTYYSGAWVDVYASTGYMTVAAFNTAIANYSTTAQMNTAISNSAAATLASANAYTDAEIAGLPASVAGAGIFRAQPSINQDVVFGAGGNMAGVVTLGSEIFDPDSVFATSEFTAPANGYYTFQAAIGITVTAGAPSDADLRAYFGVNGAEADSLNDEPISTSLAGRIYVGSTTIFLTAGDTVDLRYNFTLDAAGTVQIDTRSYLCGFRIR